MKWARERGDFRLEVGNGLRASSALRAGGCRGWSLGVYNPDLDPERHSARQIVNFMAEVIGKRDM